MLLNGEKEKLDVLLGASKGDDDFNASGVIVIALELHLCFVIMPVVSRIHIRRDMLRSKGRPSDDEINSEVGGGVVGLVGDRGSWEEGKGLHQQGRGGCWG